MNSRKELTKFIDKQQSNSQKIVDYYQTLLYKYLIKANLEINLTIHQREIEQSHRLRNVLYGTHSYDIASTLSIFLSSVVR